MSEATINLITSPDKLFNETASLLLVNPSDALKEDFNLNALKLEVPLNLYLYEEAELGWLLDVVQSVDYIILDLDNVKENHWIIGYLLSKDKTFYLTNTTNSVYNTVNVNKIYEISQFLEGVNYFVSEQK
tara:strand:- start:2575 stop:2964 length:390 start_codon:yes stop_codon:yes gene_type:complete